METRTLALVCLVPLLLVTAPASAQGAVEVHFTAIVTDVGDDLFNYLNGRVALGDTITGHFTYALSIPDSDPDTTLGSYDHHEPPAGFAVSVSGLVFTSENYLFLRIGNDRTGDYPGDWVSAWGYGTHPELWGAWIWLDLVDESATVFQSDAPPVQFPVLSYWPDRSTLLIAQNAWEWSISGDIIELGMTPVDVKTTTWGELKARYRTR